MSWGCGSMAEADALGIALLLLQVLVFLAVSG